MKPNVLLVVLDTVRAKSCGLYGCERETTPGLSALRSDAMVFDRAIAPATWTVPSHAAMFTGEYASQMGVHAGNKVLPADKETTAMWLSDRGYATAILSSNPFLTEGTGLYRGCEYRHTSGMRRAAFEDAFDPAEYIKCRSHEEGLAKWVELGREIADPPVKLIKNLSNALYYKYRTSWESEDDQTKYDPARDDGADETISAALEWMENQREPFYACLNFMEAHKPYRHRLEYLPEWASPTDLEAVVQDREAYLCGDEPLSEDVIELLTALYEAEVSYLDQQLNRLWEFLREKGLWEETLLIVTSDHGEYIGEEGLVFHHHNRLSDPLVHVPLLVKYPADRYAGTTVSSPVDLTQVDDTIKHVVSDGAGPSPGQTPFAPDVSPTTVKSEYVQKDPDASPADYLDRYSGITVPARTVLFGGNRYLMYEDGQAFKTNGYADDSTRSELDRIDQNEIPDPVVESAGFGVSPQTDGEFDVSEAVEDRLETLGYR